MNERDLRQFQFDYDQTWAMLVLRADGTVLARYGSRNASDGMTLNSMSGLKNTLASVLEAHKSWPQNQQLYAAKRGPDVEFRRPEAMPSQTIKNILGRGPDRRESCIHCHNIYDAQRDVLVGRQEYDPQKRWKYPLPSTLGFDVDPENGVQITNVIAGSVAERAGLRVGNELRTVAGQAIHSLADIQFALHGLPGEGQTTVGVVQPGGKDAVYQVTLPAGWRQGDISWRASMYGMPPKPGLWIQAASDAEKDGWSIPRDRLALKVRGVFGEDVRKSDLKRGDVIVKFEEHEEHHTSGEFHSHVRLNYYRADSVLPLQVLRDGRRVDVRVRFSNR